MGARSGVRFGAKPLVGVAVAALGLAFAPAAQAANFDVTRLDDPAPSGCASGVDCSLREAVIDANASLGPDTIGLPAPPAGQSYELTQPGPFEDNAMTGDLDLLGDVTITGAGSGAGPATIDANGMDRVFQVGDFGGATPSVELTGLTITGGDIDVGGGVWVIGGDLTVKNSVVTRNSVITEGPGRGGGLALESFTGTSHATISDSTFSHNTAQQSFGGGLGGGIYVGEGQLTLLRSTIGPGNLAEGTSGAFSDPAQGGGIYNADEATLTNVTVSGNSVGTGNNGAGGGIYSAVLQGPVSTVIESSTIVENTVSGPGGQGGNLARDTGCRGIGGVGCKLRLDGNEPGQQPGVADQSVRIRHRALGPVLGPRSAARAADRQRRPDPHPRPARRQPRHRHRGRRLPTARHRPARRRAGPGP